MSSVNPFDTSTLKNFIDSGSRCKYSPGLYLIATPIGNLEDISLRALYTLNHVDILACEDTRITKKLLQFYGIHKSPLSCHEHNWQKVVPSLIEEMKSNKTVAYVTDAGMPLISDPGYELVQACRRSNLYVTVIPGPCAPISALVLSGLPCDGFYFDGFLPSKSKAKQDRLKKLLNLEVTLIFFESPHRLGDTLKEIANLCPGIIVSVARELTKIYEEIKTGPVEELLSYYTKIPPKGEIVLLISPVNPVPYSDTHLEERLRALLKTMTLKDAVTMISQETDLSKKLIYKRGLQLRHDHTETNE